MTEKRLFDLAAAAEYLSMSKGFVEKEVREGRLRQMHLGRVRRIDRRELDRYIEERSTVVETVGSISHHHNSPTYVPPEESIENMGGAR